jgi:hypothetical protein
MSSKEQPLYPTEHTSRRADPDKLKSLEELFAAVELEQEQRKSSRTPKPEAFVAQNSQPTVNRRLRTLPEGSKVALAYGCSVCYWRFEPKVVSELYEAATLLSAQVLFGTHDCHKFKAPNPDTPAGTAKGHAA